MAGNQQFCLRWNNHQSTLVSVFDTLLESGTLVDCTLAAEGQYLRAHKVVLSACSPYLEALLSQHYEKHPIIILKDVTFIELKAMLDYMYRGEVNISQDQLGTFLKAAESLHIKGLTDNSGGGGGGGGPGPAPDYPPVKKSSESQRKSYNPPPRSKSPAFPQGLIVEPRPYKSNTPGVLAGANNNNNNNNTENNNSGLRDGSVSPKRSKRRRSCSGDDSSTMGLALVKSECGAGGGGSGGGGDSMTETVAAPSALVHCSIAAPDSNSSAAAPGPSPDCPVKLEPRSDEYNNEDSADDKHPYDDDDDDDPVESRPGTSHATNSHASGVWNASADASAEDMFAPGGPQDQAADDSCGGKDPAGVLYSCQRCSRTYMHFRTLKRHMTYECLKRPAFSCTFCSKQTKRSDSLHRHIIKMHAGSAGLKTF